ncbi:MAG TPA: cytochrome c1 [Chromatiaceae bacterium]|nr:cytochrome c1 [Chromatiaceae bacterium]
MRKLILASVLFLAPILASASSEGVALQDANIDLKDKASLQRGAGHFVNYCMGCHSLQYMRYNRMAEDMDIDDTTLRQNLIFTGAKPGDLMISSMSPENAAKWLDIAVPDLTLVTRWRSPDWVYTYLKTFYADPSRPYGVNNLVFPQVGMPNVLAGLQGVQQPKFEEHKSADGQVVQRVVGIEHAVGGTLSAEEFDTFARDLTAFLTYAGEPMKLERQKLGIYVLIFLAIFFVVAYALKKEYWKDVH